MSFFSRRLSTGNDMVQHVDCTLFNAVDVRKANKDQTMPKKRSVIEWTPEQHERLRVAAERLGMSVPAYVKLKALESV